MREACERIQPDVHYTPLHTSPYLNKLSGYQQALLSVKISRKLDYSRYEKGCKVKSLGLASQTLYPNNPMHFLNITRELVLSCVPIEYYRYITRQFCNPNGLSINSITSQGNTKAIPIQYITSQSCNSNGIIYKKWFYTKTSK